MEPDLNLGPSDSKPVHISLTPTDAPIFLVLCLSGWQTFSGCGGASGGVKQMHSVDGISWQLEVILLMLGAALIR